MLTSALFASILVQADQLHQNSDCIQETSQPLVAENAQSDFTAAKAEYLAELQQHFVLPATQQKQFLDAVVGVFQAACIQLENDHTGLIDADKENSRVLNNRHGLLSPVLCTRPPDLKP